MASNSNIEWTEQTWNPVTGCTKISPGCKYCYAETLSRRLHAMGASGYQNGFAVTLQPQRLNQPLERRRPTTYFVNSMSDLFHEAVPDTFIDQVFDVIGQADWHVFQILTKRPERMQDYFHSRRCPPNAWLGTSVEDQKYGLPRIDQLRRIAAPVRFLSIEPLLEDLGRVDFTGIDWVIVGGESGSQARPMLREWAESIRHQCQRQSIRFFFKQWGAYGEDGQRRSKKSNGRLLAGQTWDQIPLVALG